MRNIIKEELQGYLLKEDLSPDEFIAIRRLIRRELADVFLELFKKRNVWA